MAKMDPPIIPFMPLLLKDMTFSHEGNKTYMEGLLNFEKMVSSGASTRRNHLDVVLQTDLTSF